MNIVSELLGPQSIGYFLQNYFCKRPYSAAFKASRLKNLISFATARAITHSFNISIGVKARNIDFKSRQPFATKEKYLV